MRLTKVFTIVILFFPLISFSQDFNKKELKRIDKILKRSKSAIRNFDKNAFISVQKLNNGELEALIENALFIAGFEIISNDVAQSKVTLSNPLNTENKDLELSSSEEYNSVYVITVDGSYVSAIGRCMKALVSFTARIVDLADEGKLVGTFQYTGNAMTSAACDTDVANAFIYKLSELSKD